jgi:hypothetical protein
MRPARFLVLPLVAAALLAAGCGGGQATAPADPGRLLSEAGAAASGKHSARFQVVIEGRLVHRHPLPAGTSAGPYDLVIRGASTGAGGGMTDVTVGLHQPGGTMTFDLREIGTTLYFEVPGGQWYSEQVGGLATQTPHGNGSAGAVGALLEARWPAWIVGIGTRRDGRADAIDGELDPVAISTDVTRLLRQLRVPRRDLGLARYVTESLESATWTLTFDHRSHLFEGMHAQADLKFRPDILRRYGVPQPFGLPRAADGLRLTLTAHVTHWGAPVRIAPPTRATPLPDPGLPSPAI